MINFHQKTLKDYLDQLAARESVPGGGSAAALTASLGAGLVSMVTQYSIGRKNNTKVIEARLSKILRSSEEMRKRLLELTAVDSVAYLKGAEGRKSNVVAQKKAAREAAAVGREICKLCYKTLELTPYLVEKGNPYLVSDIEVAIELLLAGFNASMVMVRVNQ